MLWEYLSDDITTSGKTSRELVNKIYPKIFWKNEIGFESTPYKTLIDNSKIKTIYEWHPKYYWSDFVKKSEGKLRNPII